jgi:hypothetical protein
MKSVLATAIAVTLGAVACGGGSDDASDGGPCAQRAGTYLSQFSERSGNCGPIPEQLDTLTEQPTEPPAPCQGTIAYSADNCEVTSFGVCPEEGLGPGWTSELDSAADWNSSATQGTALMQFVVKDGSGAIVCQSTYDVALSKQ